MSENTLRDALASAIEDQEQIEQVSTVDNSTPNETAEQKADRIRDEKGRFAPHSAPETTKLKEAPAHEAASLPPTPPAPVAEPPLQRPSSWKKEMWPVWDKLATGQALSPEEARQLAKYNHERESQFASGVSTYRDEAVKAKEINDALAPFMPDLQANNIRPAQWISNLGHAHSTLVKGTPEQKAAMFLQLMNDYRPPLELMFQRGADGSISLNQNLALQARQQPQVDIRATVAELLAEERMQAELQAMQSDTTQYPHFQEVRGTMAGLLQAGLATDLKSAYDKALLHHDELRQADLQRQNEEAERQRREAEAARVSKARANAVSPRGATPIGDMTSGGKKGLRDTLMEQVEAHLGGGRV